MSSGEELPPTRYICRAPRMTDRAIFAVRLQNPDPLLVAEAELPAGAERPAERQVERVAPPVGGTVGQEQRADERVDAQGDCRGVAQGGHVDVPARCPSIRPS